MKNTLSQLTMLLFLSVGYVHAQNPIIWEVSGNGITEPSYLMGTLKFTGEKEFFISPQVTHLLRKCKVFAIEDEVDHHAQHELNSAIHFPKGESLSTALTASQYQKVKAFFATEFGVNGASFEKKYAHIKPLPLSIIMTRLSLGEKVKYYDIELLTIAKKQNLTAYSLEPVEREAKALNKFSVPEQVDALLHSVEHFEEQKLQFRSLMADYREGKAEKIFEYTLHPLEDNPAFVEEFYFVRNEEWLPKIEKMIQDSPAFLALGISHLEGERGIIRLLENKGYKLKRVFE